MTRDAADIQARILLGPGPSPVSDRVRQALARPTVGSLDPLFLELLDDVNARLRLLFGTGNRTTFALSGTGSAGMQAAMSNLLEPGDTAVVGVNGVFGARLCEVARRLGGDVVPIEVPWGDIVPPETVVEALREHDRVRLVALVHAETSTGVRQPLGEVGRAVAASDALFVVDAVTSLGGIPVDVDAHGIDVCYSATQNCLGAPPGLSPVTFSEKAMQRVRGREAPVSSWYLDVSLIAGSPGSERACHPTPPINLMYALHEALLQIDEEGLSRRFDRHEAVGHALQAGLETRGFRLFAREGYRLPQLTSVEVPDGVAEGPIRRRLLEEFGIEIGGGLGPLIGRVWRVGSMGEGARAANVDRFLGALDSVLAGVPA